MKRKEEKVFSSYQGMTNIVQLLASLGVDVVEHGWEVVSY